MSNSQIYTNDCLSVCGWSLNRANRGKLTDFVDWLSEDWLRNWVKRAADFCRCCWFAKALAPSVWQTVRTSTVQCKSELEVHRQDCQSDVSVCVHGVRWKVIYQSNHRKFINNYNNSPSIWTTNSWEKKNQQEQQKVSRQRLICSKSGAHWLLTDEQRILSKSGLTSRRVVLLTFLWL